MTNEYQVFAKNLHVYQTDKVGEISEKEFRTLKKRVRYNPLNYLRAFLTFVPFVIYAVASYALFVPAALLWLGVSAVMDGKNNSSRANRNNV